MNLPIANSESRSAESLRVAIDEKRREISSENLSMSIGELLNLYKDNELDIHPEFQRVFRWSRGQKSRLIESVLLGIPLPPVYVAVNEHGKWEVIDGVQRLSTIFEFMGELRGPESELSEKIVKKTPLELEGTKHLPGLQDVYYQSLEQALKLEFKRSRLDVKVLLRETKERASGKFDLFERLNTYGSALSPQELRNCILVSLNPDMYREVKKMGENENFRACTLLSEAQLQEKYDMDLALRFVLLRDADPKDLGDVHEFLRDKMEVIAVDKSFDIRSEARIFNTVFTWFESSMGGNMFRPWQPSTRSFRGGFSLAAFEGLALSIGRHWKTIGPIRSRYDLERVVKRVWGSAPYRKSFSGLRARERMARVMPIATELVLEEAARARKATSKDA